MKIIKRNGAEAVFDINKIVNAITKANNAVEEPVRMTPLQIQRISEKVSITCEELGRSPSVEEIQDMVEKSIMAQVPLKWPSSISPTAIPGAWPGSPTPPTTGS